jgi:hypothetical protein
VLLSNDASRPLNRPAYTGRGLGSAGMTTLRTLYAAALLAVHAAAVLPAAAQQQPARRIQLHLSVPITDGESGGLGYLFRVVPAPGVRILSSPPADTIVGAAYGGTPLRLNLTFELTRPELDTLVTLASLHVVWLNGSQDSSSIRAWVRAEGDPWVAAVAPPENRQATAGQSDTATVLAPKGAGASPPPAVGAQPVLPAQAAAPSADGQEWTSLQAGGLTKDVEVELYGSTRTTSPGGLVVVRYSINSYEDQEERVRLRIQLPEGWELLDREALEREFVLEPWETVEGEVRVAVPAEAVPGGRHRVRVSGLVAGEPGSAEVFSYVQLRRRGGLRPGQVGLTGTAALHSTSFGLNSYEGARYGGAIDLAARPNSRSALSVNFRQGPREGSLTNYRIAQQETRFGAVLRTPDWQLQAGNQLTSAGTVLTGPSVRAQGVSVRRVGGLLAGDLLVARPTTFAGEARGHVIRGSIGVSGSRGRLLATASGFGRPVGGYSTAPPYPEDVPPDSIEVLERQRAASERAPANRVAGAGVETELRLSTLHRLGFRGGGLQGTPYRAHPWRRSIRCPTGC